MCPNTALLSALIDGELPHRFEQHITDHIHGCSICRKEMARFSSLREKLQQDNITQTEITARESRLWRSIEHKMLSRKKHPLLHRSINLPLPALAALCLVMAASMVTAAYHGFAAHTYNFPPDELPSFSTMDELIGYLEQTQRTGIMEMSLPEDPVFLFISQPTLMPEREYRDAKW